MLAGFNFLESLHVVLIQDLWIKSSELIMLSSFFLFFDSKLINRIGSVLLSGVYDLVHVAFVWIHDWGGTKRVEGRHLRILLLRLLRHLQIALGRSTLYDLVEVFFLCLVEVWCHLVWSRIATQDFELLLFSIRSPQNITLVHCQINYY